MTIRISAHVDTKSTTDQKIVLRQMFAGPEKKQHRAGTVVLTDAKIGGNIRGKMVEEHEKQISPKKTIAEWNRLRYITSKGYVDSLTGEPVTEAKAVYMVGTKAYYLPTI